MNFRKCAIVALATLAMTGCGDSVTDSSSISSSDTSENDQNNNSSSRSFSNSSNETLSSDNEQEHSSSFEIYESSNTPKPTSSSSQETPLESSSSEIYSSEKMESSSTKTPPPIKFSPIEAESFDKTQGVDIDGDIISHIDGGDWLRYDDINFSIGPASIQIQLSQVEYGGRLEFHIDSLDGETIAIFHPSPTGDWSRFDLQDTELENVTGVHTLYVEAVGAEGLCNIDWFQLSYEPADHPDYELVWEEEFNGDDLNSELWGKEVNEFPPNGEHQYYTDRPENILVSDGTLKLTARRENYGSREYTSGKITTQNKKTFKYGKFEAHMKLPRAEGSWPAFWLLGENISSAGWPKCGEIDIMEHSQDTDYSSSAIHTWSYNHKRQTEKVGIYDIEDYDTGFHTYGLEWTPETLRFFVDDNQYFAVTKAQLGDSEDEWPFDQPFFIILNEAVGGALGGWPDESKYPLTTEIDWVRVYQEKSL
ncbi:MAG: family 16 glycosylhydrolase [Reichenbachiella sp.]